MKSAPTDIGGYSKVFGALVEASDDGFESIEAFFHGGGERADGAQEFTMIGVHAIADRVQRKTSGGIQQAETEGIGKLWGVT